jgi:hypothetical protein
VKKKKKGRGGRRSEEKKELSGSGALALFDDEMRRAFVRLALLARTRGSANPNLISILIHPPRPSGERATICCLFAQP